MSYKFTNGFEKIATIDFINGISTGALSNGGNQTIAGYTGWLIENCGGSVGAIQNTNATGLELSSGSSASNLIDSTRTSVIASARITDLVPTFEWSKYTKLRISAMFTSSNMNVNNRGFILAFGRLGAGAATDARLECVVQNVTSLKYYAKSNYFGTSLATNGQTANNTDDILQVTTDLSSYGLGIATSFASSGGNIPDSNQLATIRGTFAPTSGSISEPYGTTDELCVLLSAINPAGGSYTVVVTKLLIEAA